MYASVHTANAVADAVVAIIEVLGRAAVAGYRYGRKRSEVRDWSPGRSRQPGNATPYWNALSAELARALKRKGAKAQMARYLGIPRQRVSEFLSSESRLPDGELALRLLHWLAIYRTGRDLSR